MQTAWYHEVKIKSLKWWKIKLCGCFIRYCAMIDYPVNKPIFLLSANLKLKTDGLEELEIKLEIL